MFAGNAASQRSIGYLLWDFDNTLAHRPGLWSQCLADLANEARTDVQHRRELFVPYLSSGFPWQSPDHPHPELSDPNTWWANLEPVLADAFVKGAGFSKPEAAALSRRVRDRYLSPQDWEVFSDTIPTLNALSAQGWQHVILSNHVPELPQLVCDLGLDEHFTDVYTSALIGFEKPHPGAFSAATKGLPPSCRVVMIGDNFAADYHGAVSFGLEAILVRNAHPNCKMTVSCLNELVDCLQTKPSQI